MDKINLISDTVTKPSAAMLQAMLAAEVGDDVFGDDPTVQALQSKLAKMFAMEAGLFCPSGTMTNQIAIKIHTNPLDEMLCDHYSHVFQYETGGYAFNSGIGVNLIHGENGKITVDQIKAAVKPIYDWLPKSRLVVLENSCNKGGGTFYTYEEMKAISDYCKTAGLKLHLDGARLFNVLVETNDDTEAIGALFDSISICLSKGLGAPVGSVLLGTTNDLLEAKRFRKVMGGGMRQSGYLAAACIYALDHNIDRLADDNNRAKRLGDVLAELEYVDNIRPVKTNILIFDLKEGTTADEYLDYLRSQGIHASAFGPQTVRFVFHLDINDQMVLDTIRTVQSFKAQ